MAFESRAPLRRYAGLTAPPLATEASLRPEVAAAQLRAIIEKGDYKDKPEVLAQHAALLKQAAANPSIAQAMLAGLKAKPSAALAANLPTFHQALERDKAAIGGPEVSQRLQGQLPKGQAPAAAPQPAAARQPYKPYPRKPAKRATAPGAQGRKRKKPLKRSGPRRTPKKAAKRRVKRSAKAKANPRKAAQAINRQRAALARARGTPTPQQPPQHQEPPATPEQLQARDRFRDIITKGDFAALAANPDLMVQAANDPRIGQLLISDSSAMNNPAFVQNLPNFRQALSQSANGDPMSPAGRVLQSLEPRQPADRAPPPMARAPQPTPMGF